MSKIEYKGKFVLITQNKKKMLVVGDLHLGFESALNQAGIFVNRYVFEETRKNIEELFEIERKFDEIVLLGDIKHTFGAILREEREQFEKIVDILEEKTDKIIITRGNHDVLIDYLKKHKKVEIKDYYLSEEVLFLHGDKNFEIINNKNVKIIIMGHLHPAIVLRDGVKSEKYKCFLDGKYKDKRFIVVPSFISGNEGTDPREFETEIPWKLDLNKFKVIVVGENLKNFEFGELDKIKY